MFICSDTQLIQFQALRNYLTSVYILFIGEIHDHLVLSKICCDVDTLHFSLGCPSLLLKGLSEQSKQVCRAAMAQVKMLFFHLQSDRMLTLKDLNGLITNREQVEILCKSIEKEKFAYSSISQSLDEGADLLQFLDKHMKAYRAICDQFQDSSRVEGMCMF